MILNQNSITVKEILLRYTSDYRSKTIEKKDKAQIMTCPSSQLRGQEGADNDFEIFIPESPVETETCVS